MVLFAGKSSAAVFLREMQNPRFWGKEAEEKITVRFVGGGRAGGQRYDALWDLQ